MNRHLMSVLAAIIMFTISLTNVTAGDNSTDHTACRNFLTPSLGGITEGNELVSIDISNASEGYVMMKYLGTADSALLQVAIPDGSATYTYPIIPGWQTFPLSCGSGEYTLTVLEHLYDTYYAVIYSTVASVELSDELKPHLYPNEYVYYDENSTLVSIADNLLAESEDDLMFIEKVYNYVIENIAYDDAKAEEDLSLYVPDLEDTLNTGLGICFDYASLMAAMLRSQSIPTKLVFGYSGTAYHAWISVYLTEYGWINGIIEFNGSSWTIMDPTLGANNDAEKVGQYVGDGNNYTEKYWY